MAPCTSADLREDPSIISAYPHIILGSSLWEQRRRDAGSATECSVAGEKNGVGYNQSLRRVSRARGKEGLARPPVSMQLAPRHYNRPPLSAFVHIGCPS